MTMERVIGNIIFEKIVDNQTINKVKSETLTKRSWVQAYYTCMRWYVMYDKVNIVPNYKQGCIDTVINVWLFRSKYVL